MFSGFPVSVFFGYKLLITSDVRLDRNAPKLTFLGGASRSQAAEYLPDIQATVIRLGTKERRRTLA